ncbi:MAG: phage portal protein [Sneathiella sp.]
MSSVARTRVRIKGTDLYLQPPTKRGEPAFDGGSTGRRGRNWMPSGGSINQQMLGSLPLQRRRGRDLVRKVPWITAGVESYSANLVGSGIKPNSRVKDDDIRKAINQTFTDFTEESDADGVNDFYGQLEMAVSMLPSDGEMFFRFRYRRNTDGFVVPLQLQCLSSEFVPIDKNEILPNGNKVIMGVEFNRLNQRVAYHMYKEHPEDIITRTWSSLETIRVPADQVIHFFIPKEPGQVRGIPTLSSVTIKVRDLLEYEDAELVRKKTAAMFAAFIEKNDNEDNFLNEEHGDSELEYEGDVGETALEAGTVQILERGETVKFSTPADVGGNYEVFLKMQLRSIAAAMGVTYEQMTGDLKGVNFSSIRAGLMEFQRRAKQRQSKLIHQVCRRVWPVFMNTAVLSGELKIRDYAFNEREYNRVLWVPPGWRYVNPKDEVAATKAMIRTGLISRSQAVAELGGDISDVDRELASDNASADKYDLVLDSDARKTTNAGLVAERDDNLEAA